MTDSPNLFAKALVGSTALVGFGTIISRGSVFLLIAAISGMLPPATSSGLIQLLSSAAAFAPIVHYCSGMFIARTATVEQADQTSMRLARRLVLTSAPILTILVAAVCMTMGDLSAVFGEPIALTAATVYVVCLSFGVVDFIVSANYATGRFRIPLLIQLVSGALYSIAILVTLLLPDAAVFSIVTAIAMAAGLSLAIQAALPIEGAGGHSIHLRGLFASAVGLSTPLVISTLAINPLTMVIIGQVEVLSHRELLAFFIGLNWLGVVMVIPGQLSTASLSFFFRAASSTRRTVALASYGLNVGAVLAAWGVVFLGADFFARLYGPAHAEIASAIRISVLAALPLSLFQVASNEFSARGTTWNVLIANIAYCLVFSAALLVQHWPGFQLDWLLWLLVAAHWARYLAALFLMALDNRRTK